MVYLYWNSVLTKPKKRKGKRMSNRVLWEEFAAEAEQQLSWQVLLMPERIEAARKLADGVSAGEPVADGFDLEQILHLQEGTETKRLHDLQQELSFP